jgi:hypothetical protein
MPARLDAARRRSLIRSDNIERAATRSVYSVIEPISTDWVGAAIKVQHTIHSEITDRVQALAPTNFRELRQVSAMGGYVVLCGDPDDFDVAKLFTCDLACKQTTAFE